jgi:hypothetical protein
MPDNNMFIMMGLGVAALWLFNNRGASQVDQVDQLAGAAMMASGEGTTPDAPFQEYSAPANPVFFFNQGGQMTQVPGTNVPIQASTDEDIGIYPGGGNRPELEFEVARSAPPIGTTDISPTTPEFSGDPLGTSSVKSSTVWDDPVQIAETADYSALMAIQGAITGLADNIATMNSKEVFIDSGPNILTETVQGFIGNNGSTETVQGVFGNNGLAVFQERQPKSTNSILVAQTVPSAPTWSVPRFQTGGAGTGYGIDIWGDEG